MSCVSCKGDEAAKEELLKRSLSLIHEREAIDITCGNEQDCEKLGDWIDAKWSVARLVKSCGLVVEPTFWQLCFCELWY